MAIELDFNQEDRSSGTRTQSSSLFSASCKEGEETVTRVGRLKSLTSRDVLHMWENLSKFPILFASPSETSLQNFVGILNDPNSTIIDLDGIGIALITDIAPKVEARVQVSFWDSKLKGREPFVRELIKWVLYNLGVRRVSFPVRADARAMRAFIERVGLYLEGVFKNWVERGEKFYDLYLYGINKHEVDPLWLMGHSWAKPRVRLVKPYEA